MCHCTGLDEDGFSLNSYAIAQGIVNLLYLIVLMLLSFYDSKIESTKRISSSSVNSKKRIVWICFCWCAKLYFTFLILWTVTGSNLVWGSLGTWQDDHDTCNGVLFISAMIYLLLMYMVILLECCYRFYLLCERIAKLRRELC